jgi:hypothetical protein
VYGLNQAPTNDKTRARKRRKNEEKKTVTIVNEKEEKELDKREQVKRSKWVLFPRGWVRGSLNRLSEWQRNEYIIITWIGHGRISDCRRGPTDSGWGSG